MRDFTLTQACATLAAYQAAASNCGMLALNVRAAAAAGNKDAENAVNACNEQHRQSVRGANAVAAAFSGLVARLQAANDPKGAPIDSEAV